MLPHGAVVGGFEFSGPPILPRVDEFLAAIMFPNRVAKVDDLDAHRATPFLLAQHFVALHLAELLPWKRLRPGRMKPKPSVIVLFGELVKAAAQRFKDHVEEPGVLKEGSVHPAATKLPPRISCTNSRQDLCLLLSGLSKLIDIANDLDRDLAFFVRQTRPNAPSPALECSRYLRFSTCPGSQSKCTIASCSFSPSFDESALPMAGRASALTITFWNSRTPPPAAAAWLHVVSAVQNPGRPLQGKMTMLPTGGFRS